MTWEIYTSLRIAIEVVTLLGMFLIPLYVLYMSCSSLLQWGKDCDEAKLRGIDLDQLYELRKAEGDPRVPKPPFDLPQFVKQLWNLPSKMKKK